jgi:hypothetical protein
LNSSPSGWVRSPPGTTLRPGFLSHGDMPFAPVIFRQDTPCNEQGQGTNGGPQRGPDLTDNHGIAYRQQGPGRQSPRSRHRPKGDRTRGFNKKGVTRMSHSALLRLEALRKCHDTRQLLCLESRMHGNVPVRFGRGRLDSLVAKGLAAYLMRKSYSGRSSSSEGDVAEFRQLLSLLDVLVQFTLERPARPANATMSFRGCRGSQWSRDEIRFEPSTSWSRSSAGNFPFRDRCYHVTLPVLPHNIRLETSSSACFSGVPSLMLSSVLSVLE